MAIQEQYSFRDVVVTIEGGVVTGFDEGDDAIMITKRADVSTTRIGADGSGITSFVVDNSHTFKLKLMQNSPYDRRLEQIYVNGENGGNRTFPMTIRVNSSGEGGSADKVVIQALPEVSLGTTATVREWTLETAAYKRSRQ